MPRIFLPALCVALLAATVATTANAQPSNPAYAPPEVDAELPNVLLLGDSISIGYMLPAREAMQGKANVWRPATNCGPTTNGVKNLEKWLGDRQWDVIHFNFGLHDLKYMGPGGKNLADPTLADSYQQVPLDEYKENLRKISQRLKETGAIVIWRETTPVPAGSAGRVTGDAKRYNEAAAEVIREVGGIITDPMYQFALDHAQHQRPKNVHYTSKGSTLLGQHVAEVILAQLAEQTPGAPAK